MMDSSEILQFIASCVHDVTLSHGLFASLFIAGLVGGVSHCVPMCGPFVLSQSGKLKKLKDVALLPYHFGRITTYAVMAILLASVLNLAFLFMPIRSFVVAPILMVAGVVFFVTAFPSLGKVFPWVSRLGMTIPYRWFSKVFESMAGSTSLLKQYAMGLLLGFMPCGLVVSALMAASMAPTPIEAGIAMMLFGLGTIPALIGTAWGGGLLKEKYPIAMRRVTQGMMVWSGLWLFTLAGLILM